MTFVLIFAKKNIYLPLVTICNDKSPKKEIYKGKNLIKKSKNKRKHTEKLKKQNFFSFLLLFFKIFVYL